ncbi:MAG: helix-turn-helix transcriptional regulator [Methanobacteriota archaeon]|nr:MAG: helix-turn-helix transcriptional regulator [Euryarchaeota archaeon]
MNGKKDICQIKAIDEKKVQSVKGQMLDDDVFSNLSDTFKTLGDSTRAKILYALSKEELCVCDISAILDMSTSAVSHQLRVLRNMKLVKNRKDGKIVHYSLDDDHIVQLLEMAHQHVME